MNFRFLVTVSLIITLLASCAGFALTFFSKQSAYQEMVSAITAQQEASLSLVARSVQQELVSGNIRLAKLRLWSLGQGGGFDGFQIYQGSEVVAEIGFSPSHDLVTEIPIHYGSEPTSPVWGKITFKRSDLAATQTSAKLANHVAVASSFLVALLLGFIGIVFILLFASAKKLAPVLSELVQGKVVDRVEPGVFLLWSPLIKALRQTSAEAAVLRLTVEDGKTNAAVARMTQMLAHDVRKPFSILRMGLGMLSGAKDPASVKKVLSRLTPEIDKAVSSVDGLISDVMEIGSSSAQLIQEPVSPESLIEATLGEIFRIYPKAQVSLAYDLRHVHMTNVHVQKVSRVFSNIVGNAVQAMGQQGQMWFKTRERDDLIEFCIGNAGSVIPQESLSKLFDAFFTSGKKGGTGLGLAIAQKVVTAHGGRIWCESSKSLEYPNGKVEFFFTLPASDKKGARPPNQHLPASSLEITQALLAVTEATTEGASVDKGELSLEVDLVQASESLDRPLKVLVVDDEAVYRSALVSYLGRTPELAGAISVVQAQDAASGIKAAKGMAFDLVITDVDMGPDSMDGFEMVGALRSQGIGSLVCVHSNRIVPADHRTAIKVGADAFLPKPMARAQLLRVVLQAAKASETKSVKVIAAPERQGAVAAGHEKPEVLVVDDNIFILEAWEAALAADAKVHTMTSLEDLQGRLAKDPSFLASLTCVVTDMHLDGSAGDGLDVGRLIKSVRTGLPVLLSSDGIFGKDDLVGAVDGVIGKDPVGLASLRA